jgi:uncharacterized protein with PhoU and TrkA domain
MTIVASSDLELARVVRESLHLEDGDRVLVETSPDSVVMRREYPEVKLEQRDGWWIIAGGPPADYDIVEMIDEMRNERIRELSGE